MRSFKKYCSEKLAPIGEGRDWATEDDGELGQAWANLHDAVESIAKAKLHLKNSGMKESQQLHKIHLDLQNFMGMVLSSPIVQGRTDRMMAGMGRTRNTPSAHEPE